MVLQKIAAISGDPGSSPVRIVLTCRLTVLPLEKRLDLVVENAPRNFTLQKSKDIHSRLVLIQNKPKYLLTIWATFGIARRRKTSPNLIENQTWIPFWILTDRGPLTSFECSLLFCAGRTYCPLAMSATVWAAQPSRSGTAAGLTTFKFGHFCHQIN